MHLVLTSVPESWSPSGDDPAPGSVTEYSDVLYDDVGTRVGATTGRTVVLGTTPRPRRLHRTLIELPDGAIESLDIRGYHTPCPGTRSRYALTIVFDQAAGR